MKAEELMIGDWFRYKDGSALMVTGNMLHGMQDFNLDTSHYEIKPIPITPEILEKNGFTFEEAFCSYTNEYVRIRFVVNDCRLVATIGTEIASVMVVIRYVHELQHALKLCGIEKEIEL